MRLTSYGCAYFSHYSPRLSRTCHSVQRRRTLDLGERSGAEVVQMADTHKRFSQQHFFYLNKLEHEKQTIRAINCT